MNRMIAGILVVIYCFFFFCYAANAKPKKSSGIYGYTLFEDNIRSPELPAGASYIIADCEVVITSARNSKIVKRARSNPSGKFKITLPPGKYVIYPVHKDYTGSWMTDKTAVTVWKGLYSEANATFNNGF